LEYNEGVYQLFIYFKKAYHSVQREVLYNILFEYGTPMKLVRLINMGLTETFSTVRVGKNLSDMFPIRNGLKQSLSPLLFNSALENAGWLQIKLFTFIQQKVICLCNVKNSMVYCFCTRTNIGVE
jgi:hypothetical protein